MRGTLAGRVSKALGAWGGDNKRNGVTVVAGNHGGMTTSTRGTQTTVSVSRNITSISSLQTSVNSSAPGIVAHEGDHIDYERNVLKGRDPANKQESYDIERRGSQLEGQVSRAARYPGMGPFGGTAMRWDEKWRGLPNENVLMEGASRNYSWGIAHTSGLPGEVDNPW